MSAMQNGSKLPFTMYVARGFVLGVLQNSPDPEVSLSVLEERVLWQWGTHEGLFEELLRTIYWLEKFGFIEIIKPTVQKQTTVRLVR